MEEAREHVAALVGATHPKEIVFTSGATESNNIAVKGAARFQRGRRDTLVTLQTEHSCVLDSCRAMEREGTNVECVRPMCDAGAVLTPFFRTHCTGCVPQ